MPSSVVLTLRKPRRVRQPKLWWGKGGPAPLSLSGGTEGRVGNPGKFFPAEDRYPLMGNLTPEGVPSPSNMTTEA